MPTYEYVCDACDHRFERFQKISARPLKSCPECGEKKARRIISPGAGLLFKGPGFYATDYREGPSPSADGKKGASRESGGKSAGDGSSDEKDGA